MNTSCFLEPLFIPKVEDEATSSVEDDTLEEIMFTVDDSQSLPNSFTQKVVIEDWTGTWCGHCPDGFSRIKKVEEEFSGRVYAIAHHTGDALAISEDKTADFLGGTSGAPSGSVNRVKYTEYDGEKIIGNRAYWKTKAQDILSSTANSTQTDNGLKDYAICGLRLESSVSGSTGKVKVNFGFNEAPDADVYVSLYLLEDGITGYPQSNYYNDDSDSEFYGLGDWIENFEHNHVLRKIITDIKGTRAYSGGETKTVYKNEYSFQIDDNWEKVNLKVLVMLHYNGSSKEDHVVLNVQQTNLGETSDWD